MNIKKIAEGKFLLVIKSLGIKEEFCDDRERMLFESIRMEISNDGKIHWLNSIVYEIDKVLSFIDRLSNERKSQFNLKK